MTTGKSKYKFLSLSLFPALEIFSLTSTWLERSDRKLHGGFRMFFFLFGSSHSNRSRAEGGKMMMMMVVVVDDDYDDGGG